MHPNTLAIAAALGSSAAIATGVVPAVLSDHYRTRIEQLAAVLSDRQCVVFGHQCSLRAVEVWNQMFPNDSRPQDTINAAHLWLQGNNCTADFGTLAAAAEQSNLAADYPELTADVDPARTAAMEAAASCSHLALAIRVVENGESHAELCKVIAWIARFAVKAAADQQMETKLQTRQLIDLLDEFCK